MSEDQPWQPPPQQGYTPRSYGDYTPEPPASSKATLALVLGIVGVTVCPGAASIPAWIIGNEALREIDSSNGTVGGRSLAVAGRVIGIIGTILGALGLLAIGAIFALSALFVSSVKDCFDDNSTGYSSECH